MDLGQIWFVSWLGVGEEEDNRILQIIMGQNRVKNVVFFVVEGTLLDESWPNLVCELVGGGQRGRQFDFTKFRFLPPL